MPASLASLDHSGLVSRPMTRKPFDASTRAKPRPMLPIPITPVDLSERFSSPSHDPAARCDRKNVDYFVAAHRDQPVDHIDDDADVIGNYADDFADLWLGVGAG